MLTTLGETASMTSGRLAPERSCRGVVEGVAVACAASCAASVAAPPRPEKTSAPMPIPTAKQRMTTEIFIQRLLPFLGVL